MADETPAAALAISGTFPAAYVGVAFTFTPTVSGGDNTKYAFSATGLPAGLAVDAKTGVVSGTPTVDGSDGVTLTVTDGTSTEKLTGTIAVAPQIGIHGVPGAAVVGTAYSFKPTMSNVAAGGKVVVTLANGAFLPTGLSLNADTGEVSGTPTEAKSVSFTLDVTDGHTTNSASFTIAVSAALRIVNTMEPAVSLDVPFQNTFTTTGGAGGNVFWEITDGELPPELKLSSVGVLSGTPLAVGEYTINLKASTADGAVAEDIIEFAVVDDGKAEEDGKSAEQVTVETQLSLATSIINANAAPTDGQKANVTATLMNVINLVCRTATKPVLDTVHDSVKNAGEAFSKATLDTYLAGQDPTQARKINIFYGEFYNTVNNPTTTVLNVTGLIREIRRMDIPMYLRTVRG